MRLCKVNEKALAIHCFHENMIRQIENEMRLEDMIFAIHLVF